MNNELPEDEEQLDIVGRVIDTSGLPVGFAASRPLTNQRHEAFARGIAQQVTDGARINKSQAYVAASPTHVHPDTAKTAGVKLFRKPLVQLRIRHLVDELSSNGSSGYNNCASDEIEIDVTQLTSKDGIIETLMTMVAAGGLQRGSDVIKTLLELYKMQGFDGEQKANDWIDPSHVLAWMASVEMDGMTVMEAIEKQESFELLVKAVAGLLDADHIAVTRGGEHVEFRRSERDKTKYDRVRTEIETVSPTPAAVDAFDEPVQSEEEPDVNSLRID